MRKVDPAARRRTAVDPRLAAFTPALKAGLLALVVALPAWGQLPDKAETPPVSEGDPDVERAREAFVLGASLAEQGQWLEALAAFERSVRLHAHPVTTYNIAFSERALGHYTRAYKLFKQALAEHAADASGKLPEDLHAFAQSFLTEVDRRLVRLIVSVRPAGAKIAVDGRPLESIATADGRPVAMAGTREAGKPEPGPGARFELLLDPGRHVFVVEAPGGLEKVVTESFEPAETRTLELVLQARERDAAPTGRPRESSLPEPNRMANSGEGDASTAGYWIAGAGVVALGVGAGFGFASLASYRDAERACPSHVGCDAAALSARDAANWQGWIATSGVALGVVGIGLGTYMLLARTPSEQTAATSFHLTPAGEAWLNIAQPF